ncbi:MAG: hemerythrin domain-containing protein [Rhodospirillaceae bacterium]|nr:hemerythrin domain-containing protein [Rhodospirillaceae bacterium]
MPDVFAMLIEEHAKAKQLIAKLQKTGSGAVKTREQTFMQLKDALDMHMRFEEKVVYPAFKKLPDLKERVPEAVEEHAEAKALLRKLERADKADEKWLDLLQELSDAIEHHVDEEENEIFPVAREEMGEGQPEDMASKYRAMKRERKQAA